MFLYFFTVIISFFIEAKIEFEQTEKYPIRTFQYPIRTYFKPIRKNFYLFRISEGRIPKRFLKETVNLLELS